MTRNREDYLKIIYKLNLQQEKTTNKDIAKAMDISPSSASEMLKKLQSEGLVDIVKGNVFLTEKALNSTKEVLTKHRLWELFLIEYLGFSWAEVHEQAELLEHATTDKLRDSLNAFLNYPKYCPHGELIYINNEKHNYNPLVLGMCKQGDIIKVVKVEDDKKLLDYLDSLGIKLNSVLKINSRLDYDDSLNIEVDGKNINISKKALSHIYVSIKLEEK